MLSKKSTGHVSTLRERTARIAALAATVGVSVAVAACGGSSHSGTQSTTTAAAAANTQRVQGVAYKSGAVSAEAAGLKKLAVVPKGAGVSAHIGGVDGVPITQAIPTIANDINKFWSGQFSNAGLQYPPMQEALIESSPVQNACTGSPVAPTDSPTFCDQGSNGGILYWTVPWMQQNFDTDPGRVNLTFDMAQFWSLYIQHLAGYTQKLQNGAMSKANFAKLNMCITGVYVRSLATRQLIERGDTVSVNNWIDGLRANISGITSADVSSSDLQHGFGTGFNSGDLGTCVNYYG